jgi:gas vesicle protein
MMRILRFLIGVGAGALVGATVAILLAPESGQDLRGELRDRVKRFGDEMKEAANQKRAELERQLEAMRNPHGEIPLEKR